MKRKFACLRGGFHAMAKLGRVLDGPQGQGLHLNKQASQGQILALAGAILSTNVFKPIEVVPSPLFGGMPTGSLRYVPSLR